jgi:tetratricopeptide (TPR) repeat protein
VYSRVVGHEFVNYDDLIMVVDNPNLAPGPSPSALLHHFVTPYEGNWMPLTWISLHVDRWLYGLSAPAFLLTNVILHALASALLFAAFARMTGSLGRSALVAAVFALHPLHVESVAWVSERKDVLAGLFFTLGLYAWALYAEEPRSRARRIAPLLCLGLGLLSKASVVTFPFVLLLLDHWPLDRLRGAWRERIVEKVPLFALVAIASVATWVFQAASGQMRLGESLGLQARLVSAVHSYWLYLGDAFWPKDLAALYPHPYAQAPPSGSDLWMAALLAVALAAASALALLAARTHPYLIVGWLWFLGTLVPMIGFVHVGLQARADRYMYLPLVGLAIVVVWGVADAASHSRALRRVAVIAASTGLVALAVATRLQLAHWQDTVALFGRAAAVTENNRFAHENLAFALAGVGRDEEAISHFEEALRIEPRRTRSAFALAALQRRVGLRDAAIESYRRGLSLQPNKIRAHGELAILLIEAERFDEAEPHLARALARLPDDPEFEAARGVLQKRRAVLE